MSEETQDRPRPFGTLSSADLLALPMQERLIKLNWINQRWRSPTGVPYLSADFVGRQGRAVRLVDVREEAELTGPLGAIPGSEWLPLEQVHALAERVPVGTPIVLVSRNGGERAVRAAHALEALGMEFVAVLEGGVVGWRKLGFVTTREPAAVQRTLAPAEPEGGGEAEQPTGPLTRAQVERHIGDPHSVRWVKMGAFMLHGKASCVDGRDDHAMIGTPGGDAGEFLLALASVERVIGRPVDVNQLPELLAAYLETFGHFYIHSDLTAGNALIQSMRADPRLADRLPPTSYGPKEWRAYLQAPPEELRPLMLEHVVLPGNLGCGHLRLMLQHPERYMIRPALVEAFLRAYYSMRWHGVTELDLVMLGGLHEEGAVVNIRTQRGVWAFSRVPLISPACGPTQMFVNHPQVADFLREQVARFFTTHAELLPVSEDDYGMLRKDMRRLADIQVAATLSVLARGLPIFDVVFRNEREFTVVEAGVV